MFDLHDIQYNRNSTLAYIGGMFFIILGQCERYTLCDIS